MELTRFGKYEVDAKIGQGAMGEVYRASDPVLGRKVAIKVIAARAGADDELRARFRREAKAAAGLNHPNIITIFDFGEERGLLYMAMELLDGTDLKTLIARRGLTLAAKLDIIEQICDGLAFAHRREVVHRDLKPANIHITSGDQVKILDFGLARIPKSDMTATGSVMGTPNYMSPEQVRGERATARSDVFALGTVFYELLAGKRAFDADSMAGVLYQVLEAAPGPLEQAAPGVPAALCRVVEKAMRKNPAERYPDAGGLLRAVQDARAEASPAADLGARTPAGVITGADPMAETRPRIGAGGPFTAGPLALEPVTPLADETVAGAPPTLPGSAPTQVAPRVAPPAAVRAAAPSPVARTVLRPSAPAAAPSRGRLVVGVAAAVAVVLGGGYLALTRGRVQPAPAPPPAAGLPAPSPDPLAAAAAARLEGVRERLNARDPRGAESLARDALRSDPANGEMRALLEETRLRIAEVDAATRQMEAALASGDAEQASRALARVVSLDPGHPAIAAFEGRLSAAIRARAERETREAERERQAALPPSPRPVPSAPAARPSPTVVAQATAAPPREPPVTTTPSAGPPVAPSPAAAPPAPAVVANAAVDPIQLEAAARQAIRGVLDEYRTAFEIRSADALRAVQPGVDYEAMRDAFARVTAFNVKMKIQAIAVNGDSATATALVTYNPVPKPAGKIAPVPTVFQLRKSGGVWIIDKVTRK
jgi:serine/threonine-protein kinase